MHYTDTPGNAGRNQDLPLQILHVSNLQLLGHAQNSVSGSREFVGIVAGGTIRRKETKRIGLTQILKCSVYKQTRDDCTQSGGCPSYWDLKCSCIRRYLQWEVKAGLEPLPSHTGHGCPKWCLNHFTKCLPPNFEFDFSMNFLECSHTIAHRSHKSSEYPWRTFFKTANRKHQGLLLQGEWKDSFYHQGSNVRSNKRKTMGRFGRSRGC